MYTVTIEYKAPTAPAARTGAVICPVFEPTGGQTEYTYGLIEGVPFEDDIRVGIPFPSGIHDVLMHKVATKDGDKYTYEMDIDNPKDKVYYETMAELLADQGFTIKVAEKAASATNASTQAAADKKAVK